MPIVNHPQPDYEAAFIDHHYRESDAGGDPAVDDAVRWARERTSLGVMGVVAPGSSDFRDNPNLRELDRDIHRITSRGMHKGVTEPVAVVCWPDEKTLDTVDAWSKNLKALCVVRWEVPAIEAWRRARSAVDLLQPDAEQVPLQLNYLVRAALDGLNGAVDPRDRDHCVKTFQRLWNEAYNFEPMQVKVWAMTHGWRADQARELAAIAQQVIDGHQFRTKATAELSPDITEIWGQRAQEGVGQ
jgi:hypothetical protein